MDSEDNIKNTNALEGNIQLLSSQNPNKDSIDIEDLNVSMSKKKIETLDEPIKDTIVIIIIFSFYLICLKDERFKNDCLQIEICFATKNEGRKRKRIEKM